MLLFTRYGSRASSGAPAMRHRTPFLTAAGLLVALVLGLVASPPVQAQDPLWARSFGGTFSDVGFDIAADGSGNTYVTGSFNGTMTIGTPTPTTLTSAGYTDVFVVKYNADGAPLWATSFGGTSFDYDVGRGIAVDGSGNVYVTGEFQGTMTIGSLPTLSSNGNRDAFMVKYDADGNPLWAKNVGGTSLDRGYGIAADGSGNTYVTGSFNGTMTIGTPTPTPLTSTGLNDVFVVKYNADGTPLWAKSFGGTSEDYGRGIAVDGSGNAYITGYFRGSLTIGTLTTLNSTGGSQDDVFVVKYDADGNPLWAKSFGGTSFDRGFGIEVDGSGNAYITGSFRESMTIATPTPTPLTSTGLNDVFVVKYDADGNPLWVQSFGGTTDDTGRGIAVDGSGNAYITGLLQGPTTIGTTTIGRLGPTVFVVKYNTDGSPLWARSFGDTSFSGQGYGISVDGSRNAYVTGYFEDTMTTIATPTPTTLTSAGDDVFVVKYSAMPVADCLIPTIDSEVVDEAARTVTVTFNANDPSGIVSIKFRDDLGNPVLESFIVDDSDGFTSTNGIDWYPLTSPIPTATFVLQATATTATYFAIIENGCGSIYDADPVHGGFDVQAAFALDGSYPNPTRGAATVSFSLAETAPVALSVYDVMGRKVATLVDQSMPAGQHTVRWDGRSASGSAVASGVYLIRLEARDRVATRRLTVVN